MAVLPRAATAPAQLESCVPAAQDPHEIGGPRRSRFDDDPAATLQLGGEQVGRGISQRTLGSGRADRAGGRRRRAPVVRRFLQLFDECVGLVSGELAARLALRESHRSAGITEVGVAGILEKAEQLANLVRSSGWA